MRAGYSDGRLGMDGRGDADMALGSGEELERWEGGWDGKRDGDVVGAVEAGGEKEEGVVVGEGGEREGGWGEVEGCGGDCSGVFVG